MRGLGQEEHMLGMDTCDHTLWPGYRRTKRQRCRHTALRPRRRLVDGLASPCTTRGVVLGAGGTGEAEEVIWVGGRGETWVGAVSLSGAVPRTVSADVLLPLNVSAKKGFLFSISVTKLHLSTAAALPLSRRRTSRRQRSTSSTSINPSITSRAFPHVQPQPPPHLFL